MTPTALKAESTESLNQRKEVLLSRLDAIIREQFELERMDKGIRTMIRRINRELDARRTLPK